MWCFNFFSIFYWSGLKSYWDQMAVSRKALKALSGVYGVTHRQPLLFPSMLGCSAILSTRSAYERDYRRPGQPPDTRWPWQKIRFDFSKGVEGIKKHIGLLKDEFVQRWTGPEGRPLLELMLEQTRVQWEFRGPESLDQWVVSSDQEIGGHSVAYTKLGKNNSTCFLYGSLCSIPPRDGETRYSGYCTLRSKQPLVSTPLCLILNLITYSSYFRCLIQLFSCCSLGIIIYKDWAFYRTFFQWGLRLLMRIARMKKFKWICNTMTRFF